MVLNGHARSSWELGAFRLLAECRCAGDRLGGDFVAFLLRGPKRLAVVIGDVCGRGDEGARLLPLVLEPLQELSASVDSPRELLIALNRSVAGRLASDRFVTSAALEFDAELGTLTLANAGHVPAMLRNAAGDVVVIGHASGPPLGILDDVSYSQESYAFGAGDVIVSMTDGVLESVESDLRQMSTLVALVAQAPGKCGDVHGRLLARLPASSANRRGDDMTLLSLELV